MHIQVGSVLAEFERTHSSVNGYNYHHHQQAVPPVPAGMMRVPGSKGMPGIQWYCLKGGGVLPLWKRVEGLIERSYGEDELDGICVCEALQQEGMPMCRCGFERLMSEATDLLQAKSHV